MALLGVNIDHVASLRQARHTPYPSPIEAARLCEEAGADGITVHLREDRRHIQDADVIALKKSIRTRLNLEMAVTKEMVLFAENICPRTVCFVPEKREELTTEGGLDVCRFKDEISAAIQRLNKSGIDVSLFIEADPQQIEMSKEVGAQMVEIHTGSYCNATGSDMGRERDKILTGISRAKSIGLICNAGHGLDTKNILPFAAHPDIYEFNIGHSIVSRAVLIGMKAAILEMIDVLKKGNS
jgi:pyridoxine 5-phosphate synthase